MRTSLRSGVKRQLWITQRSSISLMLLFHPRNAEWSKLLYTKATTWPVFL